ncbi:MAG: hypothetical protein H6611_04450 [Ignavibacteriales bacterium]|nr:hypothetical protein [Ignavibacteriales bacterium]
MIVGITNFIIGNNSLKVRIKFMVPSGYDPNALTGVMKILAEASGRASQPEFFSTHPNPSNRVTEIQKLFSNYIQMVYPAD